MPESEKKLVFKKPVILVYLECTQRPQEPGKTEMIPEVDIELKIKKCNTWAEVLELSHDLDFLTPFPNPHVEYLSGLMMGTKKRWVPWIGTAIEQVVAQHLEEASVLVKE